MNDGSKLVFFHFSSYKFYNPGSIAFNYDRYSFQTHPGLTLLYKEYHERLIENKIEQFYSLPGKYNVMKAKYAGDPDRGVSALNKFKKLILLFTPPIVFKLRKYKRQ
jgi:hypothetical protein